MTDNSGTDPSATEVTEQDGPLEVTPSEVLTTYRYLRFGVIAAVVMLAVSVLYERTQATGWQTSLSAYYYEPVRSIFVGALMVIGFSLIVIRGRPGKNGKDHEDFLLNLAGMLAPVVALVPCDPGDRVLFDSAHDNIVNNMIALFAAGFLAIILILVIGRRKRPKVLTTQDATGRITVSLILTFSLLVLGAIAFVVSPAFEERAHYVAAYAMFGFLGIVVLLNDWASTSGSGYRRLYRTIWVSMVASVVVLLIAPKVVTFRHSTLILEFLEITLFAMFWVVQTKQHWDLREA